MWVLDASREDFLDVVRSERLHKGVAVQEIETARQIPAARKELQLLWSRSPAEFVGLPSAVIARKEQLMDFLACSATYLGSCRPFTAYCRVVDKETAQRALERSDPPHLGKLEAACLGMIVAEATAYIAGHADVRQLSLVACASTYSFAMARALSLDLLTPDENHVSNAWQAARSLTGQRQLSLGVKHLQEAWAAILYVHRKGQLGSSAIERPQRHVLDSCLNLFSEGSISQEEWDSVTADVPGLRDIFGSLEGPREERVVRVEEAFSVLSSQTKKDTTTRCFLAGYLTSRISPGTFDHHRILLPFIDRLPSALLWYGLCAGLVCRSHLLNHAAGLGRRVIRDALVDERFLDRPRCDVALAELEVLKSAENSALQIRTGESGQLSVEIAPRVATVLRWPRERAGQSRVGSEAPKRTEGAMQRELFANERMDETELREALFDLEQTIGHLDVLRERIARSLQPDGYSREKGRRKGKR